MTDNEKLIEEAAKAIHGAFLAKGGYRGAAEAALAVFVKADTSTEDEREALLIAAHKEADQRYGATDWTDGPGSSTFQRVDRGKAGAFVDGALWRDRRTQGEPSVAQVEPRWSGPHIPGPGEIMLMLAHWRSQDEDWADEANAELVARFPALDVERDENGRVIIGDDYEVAALHRAESEALAKVRAVREAARAATAVTEQGESR